MKKIFTLIVAVLIIASMSVSSFAAVTMSPYVFRGAYDDGIHGEREYIFHFGTRDNAEEEVGIEINGEKYKAEKFDTTTNTKFGIGIADPSNKLTSTYTVTPYAGETYGTPVTVNKDAKENVVINVADTTSYSAEPYFEVNSCYTARSAYDTFEELFQEYPNDSTSYNMTIAYNTSYGTDYGYSVPFIQFNMPEELKSVTNGRKLYLDVSVFGAKGLTEDYYLDVYGVKEEGTYTSENLPEADLINGIIDSALLPVEKFTTATASDRVRVRFDVTNYIKKRIYENSDTVTFAFKTRDIVYSGNSDSVNTVIYTGQKTAVDTSLAFSPMSDVLFAPTLSFDGEFNTATPEEGYTKAQIKATDYVVYQQSNKQYRTSSVTGTVQLISRGDNNDQNVQTGYMQLTLPETFKGVEDGTKIELVFYAYTNKYNNSTTESGDTKIYAMGTLNEYIKPSGITDKDDWTTNYPIRDRNNVLGSFDIPANATAAAPQLCTLDITNYVLSKMANGEDTATLSFKVEYQDNSTGTNLLYSQIYAHDTTTTFAPYVQYRQGDNTFLTDGSDIELPEEITFSKVYRVPAIWVTSDNKKLASTDTVDTSKHVLRMISGTSSGSNGGTLYNNTYNTSGATYQTWIVQPFTFTFNVSELKNALSISENVLNGKKIYFNTAVKPQTKAMDLTVDGRVGTTSSVTFTQPDGTTNTQTVYAADALRNVTSVAFTDDDLDKIKTLKIDVTDYVIERIKAGDTEVVLVIYPDVNREKVTWYAYPKESSAEDTYKTTNSSLTIE